MRRARSQRARPARGAIALASALALLHGCAAGRGDPAGEPGPGETDDTATHTGGEDTAPDETGELDSGAQDSGLDDTGDDDTGDDDTGDDTGGSAAGSAALVSGVVADVGVEYADACSDLVAGGADLDGDGAADFLIACPDASEVWAVTDARATGGPVHVADVGARLSGADVLDEAGAAIAMAGDIDGDGYGDVLIGAPAALSGERGAAYLVPGEAAAGGGALAELGVTYVGGASRDWAGNSVAGLGDFDGDGRDDLLVGAYGAYRASGAVALVLGGRVTGGALVDEVLIYGGAGELLGGAAAGLGDFDGDGLGDALLGAWGDDVAGEDAGAVWLLAGQARPTSAPIADAGVAWTGIQAGDKVGMVVGAAGDINGDGYADALTGAPYADAYDGLSWLVLGSASPTAGSLADRGIRWEGSSAETSGRVTTGLGDLDNDGFGELLIGSPYNTAAGGAAYVFCGEAEPAGGFLVEADYRLFGETDHINFTGTSAAGAGDADGDGLLDFLVSARPNGSSGSVFLLRGGAP